MFNSDMHVELMDHMGSDLTVVNCARVSFNKESTEFQEKDVKLINYLAKHGHWSPFAHCFLQFRISAPIFVARQLVKHQVGLSWNEVSRRYVKEAPTFYLPKAWRKAADNVKQGSSEEEIDDPYVEGDVEYLLEHIDYLYNSLLERGVCPEQARMILPLSTYTEWFWSGSLMAFARVCKQRLDPHAQKETQEVARKIADLTQPLFPISWEALLNN